MATKLLELDAEAAQYRMDLSPIYVQLILGNANYANVYQVRVKCGGAGAGGKPPSPLLPPSLLLLPRPSTALAARHARP